jgi:phytoene/squalene synthetase
MPTALNDLLKATSRSFYLTLHVRPQERQRATAVQDASRTRDLLKTTSRSFYLTLRVLPARPSTGAESL